jgi:nicotinate-nucleotide adenylyltransferase
MKKKIAIYWGAFNPPTRGHFHVVEKILENSLVEKIIIVPDGFRVDKDYKIEEKHRNKMIKIFIDELISKWFNIELDNYFLQNKNNSNTTTMEVDLYFNKKLWYTPWHIFWTDISNEIINWSWNPEKYIEKKLKKIFIKREWYEFNNWELENYLLLNPETNLDISSTTVRNNIVSNISISNLVSEKIEKYILKNNLYI